MNATIQLPVGTVDEVFYEATLASVRELSENATLRPSPHTLRCIPVQTFVCKPASAYAARINAKVELLLRSMKPS